MFTDTGATKRSNKPTRLIERKVCMRIKDTSILTKTIMCPKCKNFIPITALRDLNKYGGILELDIPSTTRVECPNCDNRFWVYTHSSTVSWITVGEADDN